MRYYRIETEDGLSLLAEDGSGVSDLTATDPAPTSFMDLASAASMTDRSIDNVARTMLDDAPRLSFSAIKDNLVRPIDPDEVWGGGVTYAISQESRQGEGGLAESYLNAYEGDRPEVYFKATPTRTVGPGEPIGIRGDSEWDVPEPEFTLVLYHGDIVGYTVGNDVCSRDLERDNLLYLPQSKIYANSCSIGPCIATHETVGDPLDLDIRLIVERDGETVFDDATSTSQLVRTCEELATYFRQYNYVPESAALLTGGSIMPPEDFSIRNGDTVRIEIETIGALENPVERLSSSQSSKRTRRC